MALDPVSRAFSIVRSEGRKAEHDAKRKKVAPDAKKKRGGDFKMQAHLKLGTPKKTWSRTRKAPREILGCLWFEYKVKAGHMVWVSPGMPVEIHYMPELSAPYAINVAQGGVSQRAQEGVAYTLVKAIERAKAVVETRIEYFRKYDATFSWPGSLSEE